MKNKVQQKKGFTLAELLIVVAIIAILIAIMVPVFGASRNKAILARDAANVRSAYAEAVATAMTDDEFGDDGNLTVTMKQPEKLQSAVVFDAGENKITVTYPTDSKEPEDSESFDVDEDVTVKADGDWLATAKAADDATP